MDVRQIMGAILTFSMFLMLANMIKRDHFDADVFIDVPIMTSNVEQDVFKITKHSLIQLTNETLKKDGERLKLCWNNSLLPKGTNHSEGFVTFSLTDGPEYHVSQVANAVLVAKHLGATLVLPDIIGSNGEKRGFDEIYDVEKFITSMSGVVHVETRKHPELKLVSVRVPYNANRNYILTNIQPLFYTTQYLRVITYFPSSTTSQGKVDKDMNPHSCWATFEALHLNPELQEVLDSIVGKIKGHGLNGQFIAIDYKGEIVGTSACRNDGMNRIKSCYNPMEIAQFLRRVGYQKDTTIYVTDQSRSDNGLNVLKDFYPNTFTKDDIMQETEKGKSELELKLIDFKLCSISDVFVPAKSGLFYANVVANRIASRKTEVFVPAQVTSTLARDHISSYISKRSHPAYACFCP
ncbi:protein MANNAN SYNTHESIS-RELATED 1-like [Cynara cardunculus var. scolymus]|uniref:protein MANNAN SYNTHESIS-RELATED 1-like n=1 Tax=Cynara cardunculus var. scolymus TaxID=59895 RepID=UPI000D627A14|nr:protein MANNAN SYNTHESIS-RELATED 1-like [Cynara cardunculus var. scolymus]